MRILDEISLWSNRILMFVGGVFLVCMIVLTCGNIFTRLVWIPIRGTFELMGYAGAVVTAFALGHTQAKRGHIAVDVLFNAFSPITKRALGAVNSAVCFVFFGIAAWQIWVKAAILRETGEVTETLRIIYYPFTFAVAVGCGLLAFVLLTDLIRSFLPEKEGEP